MKVGVKLFAVALVLISINSKVQATDSDGFKLVYNPVERKSLFLANYGCNSEFDGWLTRGIERINIGDQLAYCKDNVEKSFDRLIERVMPSGLAPADSADSSLSLHTVTLLEPRRVLQRCLKERIRRMLNSSEIVCTQAQRKYIDVFAIRNIMVFLGGIDRQLEPFRTVQQAFEAAGDFVVDDKGKLTGGDSSELYFKLTPSGFSAVDASQVAAVRRVRRFGDLNLDGILSGSYFLGDGMDTDFENWVSKVDHISQEDDYLFFVDGISGAFQELIDFVIPHKLSSNLIKDTRERINFLLYGQENITVTKKEGKSYTSVEVVQKVMSFLKDIDKQIRVAVECGMDREFTSFLQIESNKNKLYSMVDFTFNSEEGFKATVHVDQDSISKKLAEITDKARDLVTTVNGVLANKDYSSSASTGKPLPGVRWHTSSQTSAAYTEGVKAVKNAFNAKMNTLMADLQAHSKTITDLKALPPPSD
jgi:hypothetical protein